MKRATINGAELAYTVQGSGEPVVLLHSGFVAGACAPLMSESSLRDYRLINYHRRGYGESARSTGLVPFEQQAIDCLALMDHLGVDKAHLVGHSLGGCIALQVALSAPTRVVTLALLEAPLAFALSPASLALFSEVVGAAYARYSAGDHAGAAETWLTVPFGPGYPAVLERMLPGVTQQIIADTPAVFDSEAPAMQMWRVGPEEVNRITQPVLSVYHEANFSFFEEVHGALVKLLPQTETALVPNVTHLLQLQDPRTVAEALAGFFARHPIAVARVLA